MILLILIILPLAITELGTDGWITGLMEEPMKEIGRHPDWVLVYTSAIMMILLKQDAGIAWLGTHIILIVMVLAKYARFAVTRKW